jgi:hypothetical protein
VQMMRAHAALAEAHRQDETEERVVYARLEANKSTTPGGKPTVGAPGLLQHITWHAMMEALDMHKGYHQVSLSRVASALCSTRILARDGTEQDAVWAALPMGDAASSNSHNAYSVIPRLCVNWVLDPTARCSVQLNATEFAYDSTKSSITGTGKGLWWLDVRGEDSDDDESSGDASRHVDDGYHSELPMGEVWFCSDRGLSVTCKSLVCIDDSLFVYPPSHPNREPYGRVATAANSCRRRDAVGECEGDRRGYRVRMMSTLLRWTLNLITGAHDNANKRTVASRQAVPFFGVTIHSEG